MARQGSHCPMPHDIATNRPRLGVSLLTPSPTPRLLLDLLGVNDQELQGEIAKGHPYAFNMGSGKIFSHQNYQEAVRFFMERNLPELLHNRQTGAVLIPETNLPTKAKKRALAKRSLPLWEWEKGGRKSPMLCVTLLREV